MLLLIACRFSCTPLTPEQRASYFDLRGFSHPIHTASAAAQALFDQGLLMAYNFNHPEALRSFKAGLALDPNAAMLHWGVTYTLRWAVRDRPTHLQPVVAQQCMNFCRVRCSLANCNCKKQHAHTCKVPMSHATNVCCCVSCAACSPYANVVWGPAPADGSFEVITTEQITQAKEAAVVSDEPVSRLLCLCCHISVCARCLSSAAVQLNSLPQIAIQLAYALSCWQASRQTSHMLPHAVLLAPRRLGCQQRSQRWQLPLVTPSCRLSCATRQQQRSCGGP
jgi:hypothetical protein